MNVFVIMVTAGKVMYKSDCSSTFGSSGDRSGKQRSVCSLEGVCLLGSPIVNLLERVEVGKAFENIFSAAMLVLWTVVRLFRWQIISQAVSDRAQYIFPAHSHELRWIRLQ